MQDQLQKVWAAIQARQWPVAARGCATLRDNHPQLADSWFLSSVLAFRQGQVRQAIGFIETAITLQPHQFRWQIQLLECHLASADMQAANKLAEHLLEQSLPEALMPGFALCLTRLQRYEQALAVYQQALELCHDSDMRGQLMFNMASLYRYQGDLSQAEALLNNVLVLRPEDSEAYLLKSSLRTATKDNHMVDTIERTLHRAAHSPLSEAQLYYALGKEHEDLGAMPAAFDAYRRGAATRRANMQYAPARDIETLEGLQNVFSAELMAEKMQQQSGCDSTEPVFVLGLPRTGSTLVERILTGHGDVFGAGELPNFSRCMTAAVQRSAQPKSRKELIEATTNLDFAALGQDYINSTRPATGGTSKFVDKLPLNSLNAGLIGLALPNARMIYVQRHPVDTAFAMFKHLFTDGYPFSYDLQELGHYIVAHRKLMSHWLSVIPDNILQVNYEDVVADTDFQAKRICDFCGLNWQPAMVDVAANTTPSTTASAAQVRRKVYSTSVGKWRALKPQLEPLIRIFEQAGISCD